MYRGPRRLREQAGNGRVMCAHTRAPWLAASTGTARTDSRKRDVGYRGAQVHARLLCLALVACDVRRASSLCIRPFLLLLFVFYYLVFLFWGSSSNNKEKTEIYCVPVRGYSGANELAKVRVLRHQPV